jgi:hypothetical protein
MKNLNESQIKNNKTKTEPFHMYKPIKVIITLLTTLLFLTACSFSSNTSENSTPTDDKLNATLKEKINKKQKYIVIQQSEYFGLSKNKIQNYIEDVANYMYSNNYELKLQNTTFPDNGVPYQLILTFEYKGD